MVEASLVNIVELAVLTGGVIIAIQQLRSIKQTRQDELFMSIYTRYQEKEYWMHWLDVVMNWKFTDYDDYMNKYGWTTNIEAHSSFLNVAMFFHSVGVLLRRKRIDLTLVEDLMLDGTVRFWEKFGLLIEQARIRENNPRLLIGVDYLYNELVKREQLEPFNQITP